MHLCTQDGALPLSWASDEGRVDICHLLLEEALLKADPNKVDKVAVQCTWLAMKTFLFCSPSLKSRTCSFIDC